MKKMKIIHFQNAYTDYLSELHNLLANNEVNIKYLWCRKMDYWKATNFNNKNYDQKKVKYFLIPLMTSLSSKYTEAVSFEVLVNIVKNRPKILIIDSNTVFSFGYLLIAKLLKSKIISFTSTLPNKKLFVSKISNLLLILNDWLVDDYVVPIKSKKEDMIKMKINPEKINVIGHGVNIQKFNPSNENRIESLPKNKRIILCVGALNSKKGQKYLIESFDILSKNTTDICLVLIGDGQNKSQIIKEIENRKLNDKIIHLSKIPNSEIARYYVNADIVVIPSIEPEPFGRAYLEAMAMEKPIITFDSKGGEKDIIENGKNGMIVKLKDVQSMANNIKKLLEDKEQRKMLGCNAREHVKKNYDYPIISDHWKKILEKYIS